MLIKKLFLLKNKNNSNLKLLVTLISIIKYNMSKKLTIKLK